MRFFAAFGILVILLAACNCTNEERRGVRAIVVSINGNAKTLEGKMQEPQIRTVVLVRIVAGDAWANRYTEYVPAGEAGWQYNHTIGDTVAIPWLQYGSTFTIPNPETKKDTK